MILDEFAKLPFAKVIYWQICHTLSCNFLSFMVASPTMYIRSYNPIKCVWIDSLMWLDSLLCRAIQQAIYLLHGRRYGNSNVELCVNHPSDGLTSYNFKTTFLYN